MSIWKHLRAILLLPFMATAVIPCGLLFVFGLDTLGWWETWPVTRFVTPGSGAIFVVTGLGLMVATIRQFAIQGEGTLALWNPT